MAEGDTSTTRMGRFRICPPNSPGPPEQLSHGRFRIIPQGKNTTEFNHNVHVGHIIKRLSFGFIGILLDQVQMNFLNLSRNF